MSLQTNEGHIKLDIGFYDPFSIFQGGFKSDFEDQVHYPSFYWKNEHETLRVLKNVSFRFIEEIPFSPKKNEDIVYLKCMFISCQTVEDYRAKVRPLVLQWINSMKDASPKIPYFICFFENTELRTAADKYLKTNLFNKLKIDFECKLFQAENIFKIKSMYQSSEDKAEAWKMVLTSINALLTNSINQQLDFNKQDHSKTAMIYQHLNQEQDALICYSKLFNLYPFIKKEELDAIDASQILSILKNDKAKLDVIKSSKFAFKAWYYKKQERILLGTGITDLVYLKNICRLAETLLSFINSIQMCYKRNEISYLLIEDFLANDLMWKLIEIHEEPAREVMASIASLKLLQRNELIFLGMLSGYYVKGSMSIVDVQFEGSDYEVFDSTLRSILQTEKTFIDTIVTVTRQLISYYTDYSIGISTLATLSTELALILHYSTEDYESSCDQLVKSYEFFFSNDWKYIGMSLLEVYIQNAEKLIEANGVVIVSQLLSSYLSLAINNSTKFDERKFKYLTAKLQKREVCRTDSLIKIKKISSVYSTTPDTYNLDLIFESRIVCDADKFCLSLQNKMNETIEFVCEQVEMKKENKITLSCPNICFDDFKTSNLRISVGYFDIIQDIELNIRIPEVRSFSSKDTSQMMNNTEIDVRVPKVRFLHGDELEFMVRVGSSAITDIVLAFEKTDPDRLLKEAEYKMFKKKEEEKEQAMDAENLECRVTESDKDITFKTSDKFVFDANETVTVSIPYFFPADISNTTLNARYSIRFKHANNSEIIFSQKKYSFFQSLLPIAVSVDEMLRSSYSKADDDQLEISLFSHFNINSIALENPIRIQQVALESNISAIETWKPPRNIIAFMDQGTSFFYKMKNFDHNDLILRIEYNDLNEEINEVLGTHFVNFLTKREKNIPTNEYLTFISVAQSFWKSLDFKLNYYALTGKIALFSYTNDNIASFGRYISSEKRSDFIDCIKNFLNELENFELDDKLKQESIARAKRELRIVVTLPHVDLISIVQYKFDKALQYLVCEPIKVKVCLDIHVLHQKKESNTREPERHVRFHSDEKETQNKNVLDIEMGFGDQDQRWIISGIKTLQINIDMEETSKQNGTYHEFDINFIPLKSGKLQLPSIEILNQSNKDLVIELDYKNISESVMVVSELNKIIHSF